VWIISWELVASRRSCWGNRRQDNYAETITAERRWGRKDEELRELRGRERQETGDRRQS